MGERRNCDAVRGRVDVTAHHRGLPAQPRHAAAQQRPAQTVNVAKLLAEPNEEKRKDCCESGEDYEDYAHYEL